TTLFGGPRLRGPGGLPEKASFVVASHWRLSATAAEHLGENRASRGIFGQSPGAPFDTIGTTGRFILRPHCIGGRTALWSVACPATIRKSVLRALAASSIGPGTGPRGLAESARVLGLEAAGAQVLALDRLVDFLSMNRNFRRRIDA